eukprot:scaffold75_cov82-Cylindrotheca_fusiformis.AAC.1
MEIVAAYLTLGSFEWKVDFPLGRTTTLGILGRRHSKINRVSQPQYSFILSAIDQVSKSQMMGLQQSSFSSS